MRLFARKAEAVTGAELTEPARNERQMSQVTPFDIEISHKRLVWLFRGSLMTNFVLVAAVAVLVAQITLLFPLKDTKLGLLRAEADTNRVYRVEPLDPNVSGFEVFKEQIVRRYLMLTETIDGMTEEERFTEAQWYAGETVWREFYKGRVQSELIQKAIDAGETRSISLNVSTKIESFNDGIDKYQIDYTRIDERRGVEIERKKIRATFGVRVIPQNVKEPEKMLNPLGVVIVALTQRTIQ